MSEGSSSGATGGIGFVGALGLLFIGLKLTGHIDWPWLWVLAPLWVGPAILLSLAMLFGLGIVLLTIVDKIRNGRSSKPRNTSAPKTQTSRPTDRPYWRSK